MMHERWKQLAGLLLGDLEPCGPRLPQRHRCARTPERLPRRTATHRTPPSVRWSRSWRSGALVGIARDVWASSQLGERKAADAHFYGQVLGVEAL